MKHLLVVVGLLLVVTVTEAQKLDRAKDYLTKNKLSEARKEIEDFLAIEKNKSVNEAYYVKGKIYQAIAKDAALKSTVVNARDTALSCYKYYMDQESKTKDSAKRFMAMLVENNQPLFDIYREYSAEGATLYNENKFSEAVDDFAKCLQVFDFLHDKKLIPAAMYDTTTTLYAGISAEKANRKDDAAIYYGKLADHRIVSEGFIEIYKWLADYYRQKNNLPMAGKYLQLGRELYPKEQFWDAFDLEMVTEKGTKEEIYKKYEEVIRNNPTNYVFPFNYGVELYQTGYDQDVAKRPSNSKDLIARAAEQIKKSIEIKPDYANAYMLLGQMYYNEGVDLNNENKSIKVPATEKPKPEELKKREEIKKQKEELRRQTNVKFDEALPYFEKVDELLGNQGKLKIDDKLLLKDLYDIMITIYETKGNSEKAKVYTDKYNSIDKLHSGK